jgi:hypothetical protein
MTINKYDLDKDFHEKTDGIVLIIEAIYDIDADKLEIDFAQRDDVKSEELLKRVAEQVEHSLRDKSAYYGLAMKTLEERAGMEESTICGCKDGTHG